MRPMQGFTMVESLVALVVLSVGMLGIASVQLVGLKSSRSALLQTQAANLAGDIAERIRANRAAGGAYHLADYDGAPETRGCLNGECNAVQLAEDDIARWLAAVGNTLPPPGGDNLPGDVEFTDNGPGPDTYVITVRWREQGQDEPGIYRVVLQQ